MKRNSKSILPVLFTTIMTITLFVGIPTKDMPKVQAATTLSNPRIDSDGTVTYDCIYFGNYPQSDSSGRKKDPIKWKVLSVDGNDAFLVSMCNLDLQKYNDTQIDVVWETCTMRSWLNGYGSNSNVCGINYSDDNFIDRAFTEAEQNAILTTTVVNADNSEYGTGGGNNTQDKIFLLSYDEVTNPAYGFSPDYGEGLQYDYTSRKRVNSAYVTFGGTYQSDYLLGGDIFGWGWWLRSPGYHSNSAMCVNRYGEVNQVGKSVDDNSYAVCPALHLDLSSSGLWSYAETVIGSIEIRTEKLQIKGISKKIAAGKKITLTPVFTPTDVTNQNLVWTSSNTAYATVNSKGVVTTKKKGAGKTVTIAAVAQDGSNKKATYKLSIMKHAVKSVKITAKSKTVKAGKKLTLKATVKTTGKKVNKTLKWTSSNTKYATVSKKGVVKTKKAGKGKSVKITAKATDGTNKKATIKIKIK